GQVRFYLLDLLCFTLLLGVLVNALGASLGVLISLRLSTVRQAQQTLSVGTIVLCIAVGTLVQSLSTSVFVGLPPDVIFLLLTALVAVLDIALLALALASFQRAKLILN